MTPETRHANPYPPDLPTRVALVEERLDHIDELRVGRTLGEAVTELRLIRQQLDNDARALVAWQTAQDRRMGNFEIALEKMETHNAEERRAMKDRIKVLEDAGKVQQGVRLGLKGIAAIITVAATAAGLVVSLIIIAAGGSP